MNYRPDTEIEQRLKYVVSDLLTSGIAFFIFNIFRYYILRMGSHGYVGLASFIFSSKLLGEEIIVPVAMLAVFWLSGYYNQPFGKSRLEELITTLCSAFINTVWIYLVFLINDLTGVRRINYELILILYLLLSSFNYLGRLSITTIARFHFRRNQWKFRTLIVGDSPKARASAEGMVNDSVREGYEIIGFLPVPGEESVSDNKTLPEVTDVNAFCLENNIDRVVIALQERDETKVMKILYQLFPLKIPIKIAPDTFSFVTSSIRLKDIFAEPFVDLTAPSLSESARNMKRVIDVVVSSLVLVVLSPLMLAVAIGVRRSSQGKIIYSQERIGIKHRPFKIYKFRTMYEDAETDTPRLTVDGDTRVTPFGRVLRKYRIDELPQFWNVLKGDMSIVGPRPERGYFIEKIVEKAPYYTLVCQVRPGITSWGMVKYGYASTVDQMVERTRYDLIYLSNMSLFIDMKILIYTLRTVLRGDGK